MHPPYEVLSFSLQRLQIVASGRPQISRGIGSREYSTTRRLFVIRKRKFRY
jgi:hypothetical protein